MEWGGEKLSPKIIFRLGEKMSGGRKNAQVSLGEKNVRKIVGKIKREGAINRTKFLKTISLEKWGCLFKVMFLQG